MGDLNIPGIQESEWIGTGNCGETYRGKLANGTRVAVKKLHAMGLDRDRVARNCRRALKAPAHPGVIALISSGVESTPYHLVMEWHDTGKPINGLQGALPEQEAWPFIISLAEALAHLHRHGIHHGNLHPGNVIAEPGAYVRARVTDYGPGFVGRVHHLDIGETAWFAHPDQLDSPQAWEDGAVERWDVYRFGAVAYWLLHGNTPRGLGYRTAREMEIEKSGGRPVPVDIVALAEDMRRERDLNWNQPSPSSDIVRLRDIVDRCLSLDPSRQFHDMREVCRAFEALDRQMAIADAEARVEAARQDADRREARERVFQLARLRSARRLAACLAGCLLLASALLVRYFQRSYTFEGRITELGVVVDHQEGRIESLDREKSQVAHELHQAREAADAVFAHIGQGAASAAGVPAEGTIERENLEKSKTFVVQNLRHEPKTSDEQLERSRNLQHLAHLETRLGAKEDALLHLAEAVSGFEKAHAERNSEPEITQDIESRLADCHEAMAGLIVRDPSREMLTALSEASRHLKSIATRRPDDRQVALRQIAVDSRLAHQFQAHRDPTRALEIYSGLAGRLGTWIEKEPGSRAPMELLSDIQYQSAAILREIGRPAESAEAYAAAMESLSLLTGDRPPSDDHAVRMGRIYADLGELFANSAPEAEQYQLFNEANRLLGPVHDRRPDHVEAATWLSRARFHLGRIDRNASRWSDGYRVSLSAVEVLESAIAISPNDLEARLTLVEVRAGHAEMLEYQKTTARKCLDKGFDLAEAAREQLDGDDAMPVGAKKSWQIRLAGLYERYGKLARKLGDTERATLCDDRATQTRELLVRNEAELTATDRKDQL
jgi:tetratricopeptide (TPR) repeat protein